MNSWSTSIHLWPSFYFGASFAANTTMIADADGEEIAIKYIPSGTSPITDVDIYVDMSGSLADINFAIRVETDNADAPSGTVLGAATSDFSITGDGFVGMKTLGINTGNLTINVPVWIILYRSGGTASLSGTNKIALAGLTWSYSRIRLYTGGNWNTLSTVRAGYVVKHVDLSYDGPPFTSGIAAPASATDIYGNYRHGIRFKCGAQSKIVGIRWYPVKTGSPNPIVVAVFEGSTPKYSNVIPVASILNATVEFYWFTSPVLVAADTNIYIVLGQEADAANGQLGTDGGDDSNDYDSKVYSFSSTYRSAAIPTDCAFVYGTGNDPTAYTVSDTEIPMILPVFQDPATDLDQAAGGGLLTHPGMSGGLRG